MVGVASRKLTRPLAQIRIFGIRLVEQAAHLLIEPGNGKITAHNVAGRGYAVKHALGKSQALFQLVNHDAQVVCKALHLSPVFTRKLGLEISLRNSFGKISKPLQRVENQLFAKHTKHQIE